MKSENIDIFQATKQTIDALSGLEFNRHWNIASLDNHSGLLLVIIGKGEGGTMILSETYQQHSHQSLEQNLPESPPEKPLRHLSTRQ